MSKIDVIRQGESLPFSFDRGGQSLSGWTCTIVAKQFPDDAAAISRVIPTAGKSVWEGYITQTESAGLALGLWYLTGKMENTSDDKEETPPVRFQVTKSWTSGLINADFITTWTTTSAFQTITVPAPGSNNFIIDWGDGSAPETVTTPSPTHEYAIAGSYTMTISGTCPTWSFNNGGDKLFIDDVNNWGRVGFTNLFGAFYGCVNLIVSATDDGDFGLVVSMGSMFSGCTLANPYTSGWNVGSVIAMSNMFYDAISADPDVSNWNVGNVLRLLSMFHNATSANPYVLRWNVGNVEDFTSMFNGATSANPDLSSWNVGNATTMINILVNSAFSNDNYDLLLAAWSLLTLQPTVMFHAGIAKYTEVAARGILTGAPNNWAITDGGPL